MALLCLEPLVAVYVLIFFFFFFFPPSPVQSIPKANSKLVSGQLNKQVSAALVSGCASGGSPWARVQAGDFRAEESPQPLLEQVTSWPKEKDCQPPSVPCLSPCRRLPGHLLEASVEGASWEEFLCSLLPRSLDHHGMVCSPEGRDALPV